jgi:K+-sensing histidine kinase KdpD
MVAQRLEMLGRTVTGVAHDFRLFLQVVYNNCSTAKGLNPTPALEELLDEIKSAAETTNRLVRQMLDFAQGSATTRTTVDLNLSLKRLEPLYRKLLATNVRLDSHLTTEQLPVSLDHRFDQLMLNLIVNAVDATRANGGSLFIETRALTLERDYLDRSLVVKAGSYAVLSVSDTGSGIRAEDLERIFEPFFTTKGRDVGTGLGLSMVFACVREWNGHILVGSVPEKGSTFQILFPLQVELPVAKTACIRNANVIVREQNEAAQLVLRRDLSALGCDVRVENLSGPTLSLSKKPGNCPVQVCHLSPLLMRHLQLLPAECVSLAAPFSRAQLSQALSKLLQSAAESRAGES